MTDGIILIEDSRCNRFRWVAAFTSLSGAANLRASSGSATRHRLNHHGGQQSNGALDIVFQGRMRFDDTSERYVERGADQVQSCRKIRHVLKPCQTLNFFWQLQRTQTINGTQGLDRPFLGFVLYRPVPRSTDGNVVDGRGEIALHGCSLIPDQPSRIPRILCTVSPNSDRMLIRILGLAQRTEFGVDDRACASSPGLPPAPSGARAWESRLLQHSRTLFR